MNSALVITGFGLVTPLGVDAASTWESLLAGRFIRNHARVPLERDHCLPRVTQLALAASMEAIRRAGWTPADGGLVLGTSKGPVDHWLEHAGKTAPAGDSCIGLGDVAQQLATRLGIERGPRITISAACASGLHALIRAALMIETGEARRVLVVAAESSLHPIFIGSFRRLGVLAPEGLGCRPFDRSRGGFLLSEAAAAVCLERAPLDPPPGTLLLDRWAMGTDSSHLTRSGPDAVVLRGILKTVGDGRPMDLLHAHGTGTPANDESELNALQSTFARSDARAPIVFSHKGALGHSQGAAGLISVVINGIAHQAGVAPGNVRTQDPLNTQGLVVSSQSIQRTIRRSLAVAAGFGGPVAAVSLQSL